MNNKILSCDQCVKAFTVRSSFDSWYEVYLKYAELQNANPTSKCYLSYNTNNGTVVTQKAMDCLKEALNT
jgi:hypothetical protein